MKDNKDEEKTLFQAIDAVDDKFLMETLKDMEKRKNQNHKQQLKFKQMTPMVKAATIALICFLTLGISVSVAAATSKTFRQWIQKTFMSQTIYKVTQTKDVSDHKKNDAEQLEIMEKIRDKLGDHLEVEDRKIFVEEPEIQYTGQAHNIIQFVFKVEFLEDCRQAAIEQMMQEVNMKEMITKGNMQH